MTENEIFKISLKFVLKWEGGYVNNPNDLGGATNKGITQDTYDNWNKTQNKKIKIYCILQIKKLKKSTTKTIGSILVAIKCHQNLQYCLLTQQSIWGNEE